MVTFWFVGENKVKPFVMLPAFLFIDCLVWLIADKHLKLTLVLWFVFQACHV